MCYFVCVKYILGGRYIYLNNRYVFYEFDICWDLFIVCFYKRI